MDQVTQQNAALVEEAAAAAASLANEAGGLKQAVSLFKFGGAAFGRTALPTTTLTAVRSPRGAETPHTASAKRLAA
jgi:aerotaxis receptor